MKFEINFKSVKSNKGLTLSNIYLILQNPFYYGSFEYPVGSGNWYQGKHEPLITKELFDEVQKQIKSQVMRTTEDKEFAFTKLMTCGLCGSGITAQEKFKKQQNGNIHRYVYYGCTKSKDKSCKGGLIEEKELIKQFEELIDQVNIDEISINKKIKEKVEDIKGFQRYVMGIKEKIEIKNIDIRNYAKYILKDGQDVEKRELLSCFKSQLILENKVIKIKNK